jgi:hypothetical protein
VDNPIIRDQILKEEGVEYDKVAVGVLGITEGWIHHPQSFHSVGDSLYNPSS